MKKMVFTAVAVLVFGLTNAQDAVKATSDVKFGAKAGLNIASNGASKYTPAVGTEVKGDSSLNFNLGNVTSASMNLTLHF